MIIISNFSNSFFFSFNFTASPDINIKHVDILWWNKKHTSSGTVQNFAKEDVSLDHTHSPCGVDAASFSPADYNKMPIVTNQHVYGALWVFPKICSVMYRNLLHAVQKAHHQESSVTSAEGETRWRQTTRPVACHSIEAPNWSNELTDHSSDLR